MINSLNDSLIANEPGCKLTDNSRLMSRSPRSCNLASKWGISRASQILPGDDGEMTINKLGFSQFKFAKSNFFTDKYHHNFREKSNNNRPPTFECVRQVQGPWAQKLHFKQNEIKV